MSDLVNDYFRRHYPAGLTPVGSGGWTYSGCLSGMWEFDCSITGGSRIFPAMVCADGFSMSVQGHWGAYSRPRDDFADRYDKVEVAELTAPEALLVPFCDGEYDESNPLDHCYGYVPVSVVEQIVAKHGGLAA